MSIKLKVFIMASKLSTALMFGALVGISSSPLGITPVTAADLSVEAEGAGWFSKAKQISGQIVENGKDAYAKLVDPDIEVRQLRYKNAELERRVIEAERRNADREVMQALDYNQAMMCLGNIESLLKGYRPTILNPAPSGIGNDRAITQQDLDNQQAVKEVQPSIKEEVVNGQ